MLRMLLGLESSPRLLLPMVVLKLRKVTWLSAFCASKRRSRLLRSAIRKLRPSDAVQAELHRSGDGIASGVAPLPGDRNGEGRVVERLARRRVGHRQARWRWRAGCR